MEQEDWMSFRFEESPSDIFLQTLLQEQNQNYQYFFLNDVHNSLTGVEISPSNHLAKIDRQHTNFMRSLEVTLAFIKKQSFQLATPQDYVEDSVVSQDKFTQNYLETPVLKSNCQQNSQYRCPYSAESRSIKIERYKQKKQRRKWEKKVAYDCRKIMANKRQRVKGRFVKRQSPTNSIAQHVDHQGEEYLSIGISPQMDSSQYI